MSAERFTLKKSHGKGLGLFANVPLTKGDFVIEYTGKKIPTHIADTLTTKYLFEIDSDWTIDGAVRSNTARYINHSCDPNCEAEIRDGRIMIYAVRDIAREEELTFDYGDEYFNEFLRRPGCRCAARTCRSQSGTANQKT